MKYKSIIPVLAATFAITGVSMADAGDRKKPKRDRDEHSQQMKSNTAVGVGAGTATANRRGAEAGAIIAGGAGTAAAKMAALEAAGVRVAQAPSQVPDLMKQAMSA